MPTTHYEWDPVSDNIVAEYDEHNNLIVEYTHEPDYHGRLISENRDGENRQYQFDGQGNTVARTDDNQQVTDTFAYSAFGEVTERTGTTSIPFQYGGQHGYYKAELTGDHTARRRDYDSLLIRWLSADPLQLEDISDLAASKIAALVEYITAGLPAHLYTYVQNNSLTYVDPSGLIVQGDDVTRAQEAQIASCRKFFDNVIVKDKSFDKCWQKVQRRVKHLEMEGEAERAKKCADLHFHCICCDRESTGAFYRPAEHAIHMCAQQRYFQGGTTTTAATKLCHELTHVLQYAPCNKDPWVDNCNNLMLRELQAYFCSGECRNFAGCIIMVMSSLRPSPLCKRGEPTQEQIDAAKLWFNDAIRDEAFCTE